MSFSSSDEVMMTTGMRFHCGWLLISSSTSWPLMRGRRKSSSTRSGARGAGMASLAAQEGDSVLAVLDPVNAIADAAVGQRLHGQLGLVDVVFDQQDFNRPQAVHQQAHGITPLRGGKETGFITTA